MQNCTTDSECASYDNCGRYKCDTGSGNCYLPYGSEPCHYGSTDNKVMPVDRPGSYLRRDNRDYIVEQQTAGDCSKRCCNEACTDYCTGTTDCDCCKFMVEPTNTQDSNYRNFTTEPNDLWFNWAPNTNLPMAMNYSVAPQPNLQPGINKNPAPLPSKPGKNPVAPVYTNCTRCNNGAAQGNRVTNGDCSSLGKEWIDADPQKQGVWIDPCNITHQGIGGCTDPSSISYNPGAGYDNGSCQYPPTPIEPPLPPTPPVIADVFGCRDPKANNYNELATVDGEPCVYKSPTEPDKGLLDGIDDKTLMYIGIGLAALLILKK